jgi:hypothetical protein
MTLAPIFLKSLGEMLAQATDMLKGVAEICQSPELWHERRVRIGEEEIPAYVAEVDSGFGGVFHEGFLGLFYPPIGRTLFEHVLWFRWAAGEGAALTLIRAKWEKGRTWALMGQLPRGLLMVEAWREETGESEAVKAAGILPARHPWLRAGTQPPVPYLSAFSRFPQRRFSGLLADFASAGDLDWEFTAVTSLAAVVFASAGPQACPEEACDFALLGGPAGAILTARGMERALMWRALQQEDWTVVELLPADAPRPVWSFTLCQKHASELPPLWQSGKPEEVQ